MTTMTIDAVRSKAMSASKALAGLMTVLFLTATSVAAAPMLDQEYDPAFNNRLLGVGEVSGLGDPDIDLAQTFTVGIAGTLTSVETLIRREAPTTADLLFDIRTTAGGVPTEPDAGVNVLAQLTAPAASIPTTSGFVSFDVSAFNIAVTPGEVLAIVLQSTGANPAYLWSGTSTDGYGGGATYRRFLSSDPTWATTGAASDLAFRTFVEPTAAPEPTTVTLLGLALGAVWTRRRRARVAPR